MDDKWKVWRKKCSYNEWKRELFIEYNTYKDNITIKLDPWGSMAYIDDIIIGDFNKYGYVSILNNTL